MLSRKGAKQASTSDGRSAVNLRIELPVPDFSQFKPPLDASTMAPSQAQRPVGAPKEPILGNEAKEMFSALKDAAVKAGEIIRYQADMKKLSNGKPIPPPPASMLSTFAREVERLDQLHAIAVLLREAKRNEAKAEALRAAQALAPSTTGDEVMDDPADVVKAKPDPDGEMMSEIKEGAASGVQAATVGITGPEAALSIRRVSSTAPTLSTLSSTNPEGATDAGSKARLRQFPLKLDLSDPGLRFGHDEPNSEKPLASPVTLAPKTARPVTDDVASAIKAMTGGLFEGDALSLGTIPHSSFSSDAQQQLAAVANAMNPMAAPSLLPGAFSQNSGDQSMVPSMLNPEVIDLTQMSPSFNQTLELPIDVHGDATETIDLTMDSPTIPLSQVIASKQMETGISGDPPGTENADLATVLQVVDNQSAPENPALDQGGDDNTGLDGLLSFVGLSQAGTQAQDDGRGLVGIASDPASILAGLTGADQAENGLSQSGLDISSNPFGTDTGLNGLNGGGLQPFGMGPLQGMDILFGTQYMEGDSGMGDSVSDMFGAGSGGLGDLSMLGMNSEESTLDFDSLLSAAPSKNPEGKDA